MTTCEELIRGPLSSYLEAIVQISSEDGDCRVTLPLERNDGDPVIIWVKEEKGGYTITDEGSTYSMLFLSGIQLDSETRSRRVSAAKERFGLDSAEKEISVHVTEEEVGHRIFDVAQAVQWISFIEELRHPYPQTDFRTEVSDFIQIGRAHV